jgi:hypothetical protein
MWWAGVLPGLCQPPIAHLDRVGHRIRIQPLCGRTSSADSGACLWPWSVRLWAQLRPLCVWCRSAGIDTPRSDLTHLVAAPRLGAAWFIPSDVGREVTDYSGLGQPPGAGYVLCGGKGPWGLPAVHLDRIRHRIRI